MQLRKQSSAIPSLILAIALQWGRNFAVAETGGRRSDGGRTGRFNGAATLQLRKPDPVRRHCAPPPHASMGPQLCSCGNGYSMTQHRNTTQASMGPQLCSCGNLGTAAEDAADPKVASMGPQLCSCGNLNPACFARFHTMLQWGRNFAVAETRQHHQTSGTSRYRFNGAATLQLWKPVIPMYYKRCPFCRLQWGRNFAVAETRRAVRPTATM